MAKYYYSNITNKIVASNFIKCVDYVFGSGTVTKMVDAGHLTELHDPSIEECITNGSGSVAVVRYRELNPNYSWEEASKCVHEIRKRIKEGKKFVDETPLEDTVAGEMIKMSIEKDTAVEPANNSYCKINETSFAIDTSYEANID